MILLGAGNVRAAQTAGDAGLDTLGTRLGRALDALLHRAAEGDALFELLGDILSHQLSVGIRGFDGHYIHVHRVTDGLLDLVLEVVDALAAVADDHTGLAGEDGHVHALGAAFDINAADAGLIELFLEHFAQLIIFLDLRCENLLVTVPPRAPVEDNAYARAVGINFLTHISPPSPVCCSAPR